MKFYLTPISPAIGDVIFERASRASFFPDLFFDGWRRSTGWSR